MKHTYDSLLKTLVAIIFDEYPTNYDLLEQIILRHAYAKGWVEVRENNFILTDKGQQIVEETLK